MTIFSREWGRGAPVIALHPLGLDSSGFAGFARALARRDLRTIALDLPGFGRTPAPGAPLTPAVLAAPVIETAQRLEQPPVVVGISLGGRVALEAHVTGRGTPVSAAQPAGQPGAIPGARRAIGRARAQRRAAASTRTAARRRAVERLSGIDAGFLYMEAPTLHMHTIKVAVLDPMPGSDYSPAGIRKAMQERMHLLPPFRRRVVEVPFGIHHPVWVEDAAFDLDHHLRHAAAARPGGQRELDAVVSEIASTPLDRRHPLWELWIVDGLAEGRVAAVAKIHHALADGLAVAELLANVMSPDPAAVTPPAPAAPWLPDRLSSPGQLLRAAIRERLRLFGRLPALLRTTLRNLRAVARRRRAAHTAPPLPILQVPRTSFNGSLTARRRFASISLSLDEIKAVKNTLGVTVNDVLLGLVAGSLRRCLAARDECPHRPLVAEVPVSTDRAGDPRRLAGNRVANLFTSLCTDVDDPVQRLRRIHDCMQTSKELNQLLGPELFREWTEHTPPRLFAGLVRQYARWHVADLHPPPINVIVSSVPGPPAPLYWAEGHLHQLYSVGPIVEGVGLNVTAWSYVDRLNVGLLSCPDRLPELDEVAAGLRAALAELLQAVAPARSA